MELEVEKDAELHLILEILEKGVWLYSNDIDDDNKESAAKLPFWANGVLNFTPLISFLELEVEKDEDLHMILEILEEGVWVYNGVCNDGDKDCGDVGFRMKWWWIIIGIVLWLRDGGDWVMKFEVFMAEFVMKWSGLVSPPV